jgi:hypothetical protein
MLTDDEKARIRLEEIYRHEIRQAVEKKSKWKHTWEILNGSFCLWAMSTIVLGLGTWMYSRYNEAAEKRRESQHLANTLEIELKYRLIRFRDELQTLRQSLEHRAKSDGDLPNAELGQSLKTLFREMDLPETTAFPEFKSRSLISLLIQLGSIDSVSLDDQSAPHMLPEWREPRHLLVLIEKANADPRVSVVQATVDQLLDRIKTGPLQRWANPRGMRDALGEWERTQLSSDAPSTSNAPASPR